MGFLDGILGGKKDEKPAEQKKPEQKAPVQAEGKYAEKCVVCGEPGTEKKWAGQYWHTKCLRKGKKMARGML